MFQKYHDEYSKKKGKPRAWRKAREEKRSQ